MRSLVAGRPRQLQVARLLPRRLLLLLLGLVLRDPPSFHFIADRRRRRRHRRRGSGGTSIPAVSLDAAEFRFWGAGQDRRRFPGRSRRSGQKSPSGVGWGGEEEACTPSAPSLPSSGWPVLLRPRGRRSLRSRRG